jgi:23S rRNA (guanosine2251-2'-O)-methyltransferase
MPLSLRNPHSVMAVFHSRPADVLDVRVPPQTMTGPWSNVAAAARQHGVPVLTELSMEDRPSPRQPGRQGGGSATVRERSPRPLSDVLPQVDVHDRGVWLALDCLQDPHNVGAILRTAAFFGVRGVVLTRDKSAPLTATVYDVASGGMEGVPLAVIANLSQALERAKQAGLWVLGSSEHATREVRTVSRDRPWLLVIGNEEQGLRRLTLEHCDEVCRIAGAGGTVGSLNASVAAGVLLGTLTAPP